ncbi:MAG: DUF5357 domain-containing protein [Symploca sp. SIO2E6]|nr:DUF5357 domain-containing protein [Symploca sp. SIO2E6]
MISAIISFIIRKIFDFFFKAIPNNFKKIIDLILAIILLKWTAELLKGIIGLFVPPTASSYFSYQILFLLSLFSYLMSQLADGFVRKLLLSLVGIFLICGIYWATTANKKLWIYRDEKAKPKKEGLPLSSWITGAIACIYLFVTLPMLLFDRVPSSGGAAALVAWPIISVVIAALPNFMGLEKDELKVKTPPPLKRQNLVILFSINILLSCWFQFYFVIQDWLAEYPSLLEDDFNKSAFVVNLVPTQLKEQIEDFVVQVVPTELEEQIGFQPKQRRGTEILEAMELPLQDKLDGQPWSKVEKLLLPEELNKWFPASVEQVKTKLSPLKEDRLWEVTSDVSSRDSGYNLELQATWQGPYNEPRLLYPIQKSCQINPVTPLAVVTASVKCEPVKGEAGGNEAIVSRG